MASCIKFVLGLFLTLSMVSMGMPRPLMKNTKSTTLAARLQLDDGSSSSTNCWDSLFELQSCTSEVIMFFINGETYLGPSCCRAIHIIEHQCWAASMLGSLGFTPEEGDILLGYCDASENDRLPLGSPPPPLPPTVLERAKTPAVSYHLFP